MSVQEQHEKESEKNQFRTVIKHHSTYAFDICTKKCLTNFKSKDLSDKEKICLTKCFDRKIETFFLTTNTLNSFMDAAKKKQAETQSFSGSFS